jgi:hypothetical protein
LLYCVLGVVSVVTTAYAFVPFGNLVRERTDLVLGFSMAWVVAGNLAAGMVRMPQGLLERSNRRIRRVKMWTGVTAVLLGLAAFATSYSELSTEAPKPYAETGRVFSGGIWTVSRQRRIANVRCILAWTWQAGTVRDACSSRIVSARTCGADPVHRFVYGNRDLTRVIAEELGYVSVPRFHADISMSTWARVRTSIRGAQRCSQRWAGHRRG